MANSLAMADDLHEQLGRNIPLSEMIASLRAELEVARQAGISKSVSFEVEEVDVELQISITRENAVTGRVAFWVIEGGAERKGTTEDTHRFKLRLRPKDVSGTPLVVKDDEAILTLPGR